MTADGAFRPDHEVRDFLVTTFVLEAICMAIIAAEHLTFLPGSPSSLLGNIAFYAQGWTPGLAALLTRWRSTRSLRGLGWGAGRTGRYLAVAIAVPFAICAVAYGLALASGSADLNRSASPFVLLSGLFYVIPFGLLVLGEELGWRGLMTNRLAERMSLWRVAGLTGLAITVFDAPMVLLVPGSIGVPAALAIPVYAVGNIAFGYPLAWLRERSRSLWPPVIMSTAFAVALIGIFGSLVYPRPGTEWLTDQSGILLATSTLGAAFIWWLCARPDQT